MPFYVEIAVNLPQVQGVFHYHLPPELAGKVEPGHLVEVPFGRQIVQGVVLRCIPEPDVENTRPVRNLLDLDVLLTPAQIELARGLSHATLASLAECIALMIPPGLSQVADTLYELAPESTPADSGRLSPLADRLLQLLQKRGPLRGRQIDQAIPRLDWRKAAQVLSRRGLIQMRSILPPPGVQPKSVRTAQLAVPPEVAEKAMPDLGRDKALARRQAILRYLIQEAGPVDAPWIYASSGGNLSDLRSLAERGLVLLGESEIWRDPLSGMDVLPTEPPNLTSDQQAAWGFVQAGLLAAAAGKSPGPHLLHGVTGSGKTEIYLRAVEETIRSGRQAIVLVPEIALTPQTVRRFMARFPGRVGLYHHLLSTGERYDTWRRARAGLLSLVVGPRSALFTPFPNLGLIVVDEFHDDSYYQSDPRPYYHACQAAVQYAHLASALCLLGSATPDILTRYRAEAERQSGGSEPLYRYISLPTRILAHRQVLERQVQRLSIASHYQPLSDLADTIDLPAVRVVDMRVELQAGHTAIFSRSLQAALAQVLERKQQAILFLNRRGSATFVFCRDCGYALKCPHCDLPLTSHVLPTGQPAYLPSGLPSLPLGPHDLQCHYCGYRRKIPKECPECGSRRIREYGTGTERVVDEVRSLFPGVRTLRWDFETTRQKGAHEIIMSHFANHRADVLVGTQMIAKGLDLPLVTLVGVVLADVGLNMPDYRASERTFQILTQVAGRAGRSPLGGQVILQTFQPNHYVIQAAARHDYLDFYQKEINYRRALNYPPFSKLVRLEYRHSDNLHAEQAARNLASQIKDWLDSENRRATDMIGPVPCFFERIGGIYRWQIILRGPDPISLLRNRQIGEWRIEVDPISLL
jgi:primosomal protein N' (replication factor Y) (superfamily II helicase)